MTNVQANRFAPRGNRKTTEVQTGDAWANTEFLAPGLTEERVSESVAAGEEMHKAPWEKGQIIGGIFGGLQTKKNPPAKGCKQYLRFTAEDGTKFRVDAPGQLAHIGSTLTVGEYAEIRYEGKVYVESLKSECHQFTLLKEVLN